MLRLVQGVGVNDADYDVVNRSSGKQIWCPYYRTWVDMLRRAYCLKLKKSRPSYVNVSVCKDWLSFMAFRKWMILQDFKGKQLDKDLLVKGNKVYGPQFCIFVTRDVNLFMTDRSLKSGAYPTGVSFNKVSGKYQSRVRLLGKGQKHLGVFETMEEAHQVWWKAKCELAKELA